MKKFNFTHDENEVSPSYIGELELESVGNVKIITISNDDGLIPHFYIFNDHFEISICIFDNKYYGKDLFYLSPYQKCQLNEYLKTKNIHPILGESKHTVWQEIVTFYNMGNPNKNYDKIIKEQPNYEIMEDYIYG